MRKIFNFETMVVAVALVALVLTIFVPSTSNVSFASDNSASGNNAESSSGSEASEAPSAPRVDPAIERNEAFIREIVEEGSKIENRSTSGVTSDAPGLYLTKKVSGVAIKANEGASFQGTQVSVADTDTSKSSAAMACVDAAAAANGLTVGPSIDIYAKGANGNSAVANMGAVYVGLPADFQNGTSYYAIVVAPGGTTTVLPATITPDGKSIAFDLNGLDAASRTAKQLLISVCKK